jgi:hypothetical protein
LACSACGTCPARSTTGRDSNGLAGLRRRRHFATFHSPTVPSALAVAQGVPVRGERHPEHRSVGRDLTRFRGLPTTVRAASAASPPAPSDPLATSTNLAGRGRTRLRLRLAKIIRRDHLLITSNTYAVSNALFNPRTHAFAQGHIGRRAWSGDIGRRPAYPLERRQMKLTLLADHQCVESAATSGSAAGRLPPTR